MSKILFKCKRVDASECRILREQVQKTRSCHLKGFAFGFELEHDTTVDLEFSLAKASAHIAADFETICWDGDGLAKDSFTASIPIAISHRLRTNRAPSMLWAGKIACEEDLFLSSWDKKVVITDQTGILSIRDSSELTIDEIEAVVIIQYSLFSHLNAQEYVPLSANFHCMTGCKDVVAFGGGNVLQCEFDETQKNNRRVRNKEHIENLYGYPDHVIRWTILPCTRQVNGKFQPSFSYGFVSSEDVYVINRLSDFQIY
jgi:hypothetical protein